MSFFLCQYYLQNYVQALHRNHSHSQTYLFPKMAHIAEVNWNVSGEWSFAKLKLKNKKIYRYEEDKINNQKSL